MWSEGPVRDIALYHCERTVVKSLKAMLLFRNKRLPRTEDITALLRKCKKHDKTFEKWLDEAEDFMMFTSFFTYAGEVAEANLEDSLTTLNQAKELHEFVASVIRDNPA